MLLNIVQCSGQPSQQNVIWLQMSTVLRLRSLQEVKERVKLYLRVQMWSAVPEKGEGAGLGSGPSGHGGNQEREAPGVQ